jgi:hypothetical protein
LHAISAAWPAIVGLDVAANCAPLSLAHQTLTIATRSSAWSQQLQFLSPAILRGIGEHAPGTVVTKLLFRAGAFAPRERRAQSAPAAGRERKRREADVYEPAADLADAFERVRARIRAARRAAPATCAQCGAPLLAGDAATRPCAACAIERGRSRTLELERLIFAAPWLTFAELHEHLPRLTVAEYERSRRRLLNRWWVILERARATHAFAPGQYERSIASSYVLLQTRLAPDAITPEVVTNALGAELAALLLAQRAQAGSPSGPARRS